jgi:hypothetical protein
MAFRPPPQRHWRAHGTEPLPTTQKAMQEPLQAFPSWYLRIECDRRRQAITRNEVHMTEHQRSMVLRVLIRRMRHENCGGRAARAELLTGVEGSSRPMRRIVLLG